MFCLGLGLNDIILPAVAGVLLSFPCCSSAPKEVYVDVHWKKKKKCADSILFPQVVVKLLDEMKRCDGLVTPPDECHSVSWNHTASPSPTRPCAVVARFRQDSVHRRSYVRQAGQAAVKVMEALCACVLFLCSENENKNTVLTRSWMVRRGRYGHSKKNLSLFHDTAVFANQLAAFQWANVAQVEMLRILSNISPCHFSILYTALWLCALHPVSRHRLEGTVFLLVNAEP